MYSKAELRSEVSRFMNSARRSASIAVFHA
jgi:hypothetical protein